MTSVTEVRCVVVIKIHKCNRRLLSYEKIETPLNFCCRADVSVGENDMLKRTGECGGGASETKLPESQAEFDRQPNGIGVEELEQSASDRPCACNANDFEVERLQRQKMEAVGQLTCGTAGRTMKACSSIS